MIAKINQCLTLVCLCLLAFVLGGGIYSGCLKRHANDPRAVSCVSDSDVLSPVILIAGDPNAKTKVVVVSGDTCPACIQQEDMLEQTCRKHGAALYVLEQEEHPGSKADALVELQYAHSPAFAKLH